MNRSTRGFGLIEALVSTLFLTVASLALLQALSVAVQSYALASQQWRAGVDAWNQSRSLRAEPAGNAEALEVLPGGPCIYRFRVQAGAGRPVSWEVLCASK